MTNPTLTTRLRAEATVVRLHYNNQAKKRATLYEEAADRIEALEAALREIAEPRFGVSYSDGYRLSQERRDIARAALGDTK